ncbi:unnamed protein product [Musa textilis]
MNSYRGKSEIMLFQEGLWIQGVNAMVLQRQCLVCVHRILHLMKALVINI